MHEKYDKKVVGTKEEREAAAERFLKLLKEWGEIHEDKRPPFHEYVAQSKERLD